MVEQDELMDSSIDDTDLFELLMSVGEMLEEEFGYEVESSKNN